MRHLNLGAYIARYDNYSVVALPEPSSVMLFVLGLGVLFFLRRHRRGPLLASRGAFADIYRALGLAFSAGS